MAATVIPILYLALTLQGSTFEGLVKQWEKSSDKKGVGADILFFIALFVSIVILCGAIGEFISVNALYTQHASQNDKWNTLVSLYGLMALVAIRSFLQYLRTYFKLILYPIYTGHNALFRAAFSARPESNQEGALPDNAEPEGGPDAVVPPG